MMRRLFLLLVCVIFCESASCQWPQTVFERSEGKETVTYPELIKFYQQLDRLSNRLKFQEMGASDAGYPLHLILFSNDGKFDPKLWHRQNKLVFLINNGIHPGEPDGIDASMLLLRDLCQGKKSIPDNIVLAVIPVYNIGGMLNRSSFYRVDQNGPDAFGSRGNSQNLDLNRDFIKADSREALSFARIYQWVNPHVFVDNHVSNGADYQHVMTLICSQHNKLGGKMGEFMHHHFEPGMYRLMKAKGYDLVPYVNSFEETPDAGWPEFLEGPRYSTGYATLWNSFAFMPETHMLKPYPQRVQASYALMECFIRFATENQAEIRSLRAEQIRQNLSIASFPLQWQLDRSKFDSLVFKGYAAGKKTSKVSGLPRLYYDRNKPFEKTVHFYNNYSEAKEVSRPRAYILPQGWWKVAERLQANNVLMQKISRDTVIEVEAYLIEDYKTSGRPFESHHLNSSVTVNRKLMSRRFRKGDWLIPMNQPANRFLVEVLEPQAMDSYFVWNFFDAVLAAKEGYSDYMFEDTAGDYLAEHPDLKTALEQKKAADTAFAKNADRQLEYIFQNSPWYEPEHNLYPVFRLLR